MKVFVVYGFWKYENCARILEVFDTLEKAQIYVNTFDYTFKVDEYDSEFDYLNIQEKEIK